MNSDTNPSYDVTKEKDAISKALLSSSKPDASPSFEKSGHFKAANRSSNFCNRPFLFVAAALAVVGLVACASIAISAWSLAGTRSDAEQQSPQTQPSGTDAGNSTTIARIDSLEAEIESLQASLEVLEGMSANVTRVVDSLQISVSATGEVLVGRHAAFPASSCLEVFVRNPLLSSGEYWLRASNGSAVLVYCDMDGSSCGNVTTGDGGWMRVANLDFESASSPCPESFKERNDSNISTCGINSTSFACASVLFETYGIPYSRVCGRVLAYQYSTPNAFRAGFSTIGSNYVDGVSLTHGSSPRRHIWTFAAALHEGGSGFEDSVCDCSNTGSAGGTPPAFVGQDYFCDSGIPRQFVESDRGRFFSASPLWDGSGCGPDSTCCSFNDPPWFHKQLPSPTSDPIEMRACRNEDRVNEDIPVSSVELFVR